MTTHIAYQQGVLHIEQVSVQQLAQQFGTPLYAYSKADIAQRWQAFSASFQNKYRVCYAVKANSNLGILQVLASWGAGFDVVSGGEVARVLKAGAPAQHVVFSGVAKTDAEIEYALRQKIGLFNIESVDELEQVNGIAQQLGVIAPVSLRINPDVDAKTHPYIATGLEKNKFGIAMDDAREAYQFAAQCSHLELVGAACHIGSQLTSMEPFLAAMDRMLLLIADLFKQGLSLRVLDMGGGLGIQYDGDTPPSIVSYIQALQDKLQAFNQQHHTEMELMLEPGRALVGESGVLITQVQRIKENKAKRFTLVDAGMNDLLRPALYQAWHDIVPVDINNKAQEPSAWQHELTDIVGPVCETGDFLGESRRMNALPGDLLAVKQAGAYASSMSSHYNSRPKVAEVLVDQEQVHVIQRRETLEDLWRGEQMPFATTDTVEDTRC